MSISEYDRGVESTVSSAELAFSVAIVMREIANLEHRAAAYFAIGLMVITVVGLAVATGWTLAWIVCLLLVLGAVGLGAGDFVHASRKLHELKEYNERLQYAVERHIRALQSGGGEPARELLRIAETARFSRGLF